ncbi:MAG: hypothetical protein V1792_22900 [Pseudomonadota bacterium]
MSASHPRYRLKLYGQTTSDPDRFARKAAVLLEMSSGAVHSLMLDLPVILKKDLDEDRAQSLKNQLDALGALTIIEPMAGTAEGFLPVRTRPQVSAWDRLREIWNGNETDPEARIYAALLIGAAVLLSTIVTFGYSASLVKLFRQQAPIVSTDPAFASARSSPLHTGSNPTDSTRLMELDSGIDELDARIKTLQSQYHEADNMLQRVNSSFSANPGELFEHGREAADLRNEIRDAHSKLMHLKNLRSRSEG